MQPTTDRTHPPKKVQVLSKRSSWALLLIFLTLQASVFGEDGEPAAPQTQSKNSEGIRFLWRKPPSLRFGNWLRIDFRAKFQGDFRTFTPGIETDEGLFDFHRKRVSIEGHFLKHFEYEVESELSKEDHWKDVFLNFRYYKNFQIKAGRFKLPFGMEQTTGNFSLDFISRSLLSDNLTPARDNGIMAHGRFYKRGLNYEGGLFERDGENARSKKSPGAERTFAGRLTGTPLRLLPVPGLFKEMSFGMAFTSSTVPEGLKGLRGQTIISSKTIFPEYYVHGQRLRLGWEWNWSPGPFSLNGEFVDVRDQRLGQSLRGQDLPDLVSRGWYLSGTWAITGEKKADGIEPRRPFMQHWGLGAIELAARYEALRFGSSEHIGAPSRSPRASNILGNSNRAGTLGVNWYLNRWAKIQFNLIRETLEDLQRSPIPGEDRYWTRIYRLQFVM